MDNSNITYVIHIATTPEKLWEALTSPEALKKNWGKIESQWTVGSKVTEVDDSGKVLWKGEVLHTDDPSRLSFTFDVTGSGERTKLLGDAPTYAPRSTGHQGDLGIEIPFGLIARHIFTDSLTHPTNLYLDLAIGFGFQNSGSAAIQSFAGIPQ